jgi:hypothetical protein
MIDFGFFWHLNTEILCSQLRKICGNVRLSVNSLCELMLQ